MCRNEPVSVLFQMKTIGAPATMLIVRARCKISVFLVKLQSDFFRPKKDDNGSIA